MSEQPSANADALTAFTVVLTVDGRIVVITEKMPGLDTLRPANQVDMQMACRFIYDQLANAPRPEPEPNDDIANRIRERLAEREVVVSEAP